MRPNSAAEQLPGNLCLSPFLGRERLLTFPTLDTATKMEESQMAPPTFPAPRRVVTPFPRRLAATVRNLLTGVIPWRQYRREKPLTIVVLGMHRSGTSCIARMINLCGAAVGREVVRANASNKAGHWEPAEGVDINEAILRLSGGAWDAPPRTLRTDLRFRWSMKGFLGRLHEAGTAVWKDPRTVLTFPLWKPLLCRYQVVAVFRNPLSVAESLRRREADFPIERGLALWKVYNENLLRIVAGEQNPIWIDFDSGLEQVTSRVKEIAAECGLTYGDSVGASYSPELRTSDQGEAELDASIQQLYERLLTAARSNRLETAV
jgi:hypothetical protein